MGAARGWAGTDRRRRRDHGPGVAWWDMASTPTALTRARTRVGAHLDGREPGWLARPARATVRPLFSLLYNADVGGVDNVPDRGPVIISANHRSFFDTPALMLACPRPVVFLGKAEYMDHWKTRYAFPALGMVPIQRQAARASMAALETAKGLLGAGRVVGIYPEGTRSRDGLLHRGQTGVAHLALLSGAPIVPVGLTGTEDIQPIGAGVPRWRGELSVTFGEPIWPQNYQSGGGRRRRKQITDDVMASIASMTDQERSPAYASDEPPLIRGGTETVYRVIRNRGRSDGWRSAAQAAVADVCTSYDDARVGEVSGFSVRVGDDGEVEFETDISVSIRFRGGEAR